MLDFSKKFVCARRDYSTYREHINAPVFRKMRKEKGVSYYNAYCEGWSNVCGAWATKERFVTPELLNRGRYGKPMYPNRSKRKDIKGRKRNK